MVLDLKKTFLYALEQQYSPINRNYYKCGHMTSFASTHDLKLATPGYNTHLKCPFQPHEMTTCRNFHGPLFFTTQGKVDECMLQTQWSCVIEEDLWCNGFSQCLWDECHCPGRDDNAVFACPGPDQGCVTFTHVCDGHVDCPGGEDERACTGAVLERCWSQMAVYSEIYTNYNSRIWCEKYVNDREWECTRDISGPELRCIGVGTDITTSRDANIECLIFLISFIMSPDADQDFPLSLLCDQNCVGVSRETCSRVIRHMGLPAYKCQGSKEVVMLDDLCDGEFSCPLKDDEKSCSNMFYCEEQGTTSVNVQYTCDGKWDCKNGADECLESCMPGETSDVKNLIKPGIKYTLLSIFILLLISISVFCRRFTGVCQIPQYERPERNLLQCLLILYSCCMTGYILIVLCMDLHYRGSFCVYYITWRAGILCQILGVIFSFSTHGSFLVIIQMSLDSLRNMMWCTTDYRIRYSTAATHVFGSIVLAVLPLKGLGIFSTDIHFPQAIPFKTTPGAANASIIKSIFRVLNGSDTIAAEGVGDPSDDIPPGMIEFLKNTTNTPEIYEHVTMGYYGRITPLCVGDIFSPMQSGDDGKMLYGLAILFALLALVGNLLLHLLLTIAGLNEFITNRQDPKQQPAPQIVEQHPVPQIAEQQQGPQIAEQQPGIPQQPASQITQQQPAPQIAEQQPGPQIAPQQPGIPQQPAQTSSMQIHVIAASKALAWIVVAASILNPNLALLETADHEGVYGLACFGSLVVTSTIDAIV
eukprot:sb/3462350/